MKTGEVRVQDLGKRYVLGAARGRQKSLREAIPSFFKRGPKQPARELWALRELSFDLAPGERLGIIGRNGAGKSTLLKLLSRIAYPTEGSITMRGRLASLLEVGTGFHPELTGRENIYLNGAILGMHRSETARRFDEIVDFAGVEKFLDTPVKRYSSGMYVRLAFAVAAHLEPDILILDEVLAVGDAQFQKKCLGKVESAGREGRTVFFVSHSMSAVQRLCSSAVVLEGGRLAARGPVKEMCDIYLGGIARQAERRWSLEEAPGTNVVKLRSLRVSSSTGEVSETIDVRRSFAVEFQYEVFEAGHVLIPNLHLRMPDGTVAFISGDTDLVNGRRPRAAGLWTSKVFVPGNLLNEGLYDVAVALGTYTTMQAHFFVEDALRIEMVDPLEGDSARADYPGPYAGVVRPMLEWTTEPVPEVAAASVDTRLPVVA